MKPATKLATELIGSSLKYIQTITKGLCKPTFGKEYLPVIEREGNTILIVDIGVLLGLRLTRVSLSTHHYVEFPDGKSLLDMANDPEEFDKWYKLNCTQ